MGQDDSTQMQGQLKPNQGRMSDMPWKGREVLLYDPASGFWKNLLFQLQERENLLQHSRSVVSLKNSSGLQNCDIPDLVKQEEPEWQQVSLWL